MQVVSTGTCGKPFKAEPVGCTEGLDVGCGTKEKNKEDSEGFSLSNDHLLS